jgi:glycosyltransferase involved in cell wall biosynthesis
MNRVSSAGPVLRAGEGGPLRISVVIPHLNQPAMLARCLASLAAGTRQPDEILVVDNGSADLPQAVCDAHPGVRLLAEATPGPGPARNRGVAHATGEVLAFIDADCLADPGWLAAAEAALADPAIGILGGDVRIALVDPARLTMLEAYESIYAYRMEIYIARHGFTGTGNLVVRRPVLDAVGPFAGLSVAEDRDWGQRATGAGHVIRYVPGMKVYHPARERFSELQKKWDRHTAHDFTQARTRRAGRSVFAAKTLAMGLSPLAELPRVLLSDRISGLRNRALALAGLTRIRLYRTRVMLWLLAGGDPEQLSGRWNRPQAA